MPAAVARRQSPSTDRYVAAVKSWRCGRGPEEAGQLAGDRDRRDVCRLAALFEAVVDSVQAALSATGDLKHVVGVSGLTA